MANLQFLSEEEQFSILDLLAPDKGRAYRTCYYTGRLEPNPYLRNFMQLNYSFVQRSVFDALCGLGIEKIIRAIACTEQFSLDFIGQYVCINGCVSPIKTKPFLDMLYSTFFYNMRDIIQDNSITDMAKQHTAYNKTLIPYIRSSSSDDSQTKPFIFIILPDNTEHKFTIERVYQCLNSMEHSINFIPYLVRVRIDGRREITKLYRCRYDKYNFASLKFDLSHSFSK